MWDEYLETDNELVTYIFFAKAVQQSTKKTVPPDIEDVLFSGFPVYLIWIY